MEFHEDGCIAGSGQSQNYLVVLEPDCPHTVGQGGLLVVSAMSADLARSWARTHKPPQMHIANVLLAPAGFRVVPDGD